MEEWNFEENPHLDPYHEWSFSPERFSSLSPEEIVAMARLVTAERDGQGDLGQQGESVHIDDIADMLGDLPKSDLGRATEIMTAFVKSPYPEDRYTAALAPTTLTKASREAGLPLWDRLVSDSDKKVRDMAIDVLEEIMETAVHGDYTKSRAGFYTVDAIDEAVTAEYGGITRQDAYNLYESYAYAENGQYFDVAVGRAALAKINAIQPPSS